MKVNFIKKKSLNVLLILTMVVSSITVQGQTAGKAEQLHGEEMSLIKSTLSKMKSVNNNTFDQVEQTGFRNSTTLENWGVKHWLKYPEHQLSDTSYEYYEHLSTGMNIPFASVLDANGNSYITGAGSNVDSPEGNFVTIKIDAEGNHVWEARQPGIVYSAVFGTAITLADDSNPVATGTFWNGNNMDIQTIKFNAETGEIIWQVVYDGSDQGLDVPSVITTDTDGNIIVAGITYVGNEVSYLVLKYDDNGNLLWSVTDQNMVADSWFEPTTVDVDASGNIGVTGYGVNQAYYQCYYTIKYNAQGELVWKNLYQEGIAATANSIAHDVSFDNEGNCYVTGNFAKYQKDEIATIKYSPSGEVMWFNTYKSGVDVTYGLAIEFFGSGVYVAGCHFGDWIDDGQLLLSLDQDGNINWVQESNDLIDIRTTHLALTSSNLPVIAGLGYDENTSDYRIKILQFDENGSLLDSTNYFKPFSPTESLMGYVGFDLDNSGNPYLYLDAAYSELGNVFETVKLAFTDPDPLWKNIYTNNGGSNSQILNAITDQFNNTYVTSQFGTIESDLYISNYELMKYNDQGVVEWEMVFNPANGNASDGIVVGANQAGEVIVYLIPSPYEGLPLKLKKYDTGGSLIWETEKQVYMPELYTFMIDKENNIYIAGSSYENMSDPNAVFTVIKFSDAGEELWTTYKGSDNPDDNVFNINAGTINPAGDLIYTGTMGSGGFFDQNVNMILMKFTSAGDFSWISSIQQSGFNSSGTDLLLDDDNNIYVNGFNQDKITFGENMLVCKYDDQGNQLWVSEYGETDRRVRSYDICQYSNQHVVVSGFSVIDGVDNKVILVNYDPEGNRDWVQSTEYLRFYKDMYLDGDDNLFVFNQAQISTLPNRIYYGVGLIPIGSLFIVDENGTTSEDMFIGPELSLYMPTCLVPLNNGKLLMAGELTHELNFFEGIYLFETTHVITGMPENDGNNPNSSNNYLGQNYPNPSNAFSTNIPFYLPTAGKVELSIYDLQGRLVLGGNEVVFSKGNHVISIDISSLKQGTYLYQIKTNNFNSSRMMVVN
ncbi:MAG: T9SS type A sorting domain-containing protein [Bacteroidales bacterium]|jgi:hypothetical protein